MKDLMIRVNEPLPKVTDWSIVGDILVYTRLNHEMKLFVDEANKNGKTIVGKNKEAQDSIDSHFTGANI